MRTPNDDLFMRIKELALDLTLPVSRITDAAERLRALAADLDAHSKSAGDLLTKLVDMVDDERPGFSD